MKNHPWTQRGQKQAREKARSEQVGANIVPPLDVVTEREFESIIHSLPAYESNRSDSYE